MSTPLVRRIEALEAAALSAQCRPMPQDAAERADQLHSVIWSTSVSDNRCKELRPTTDGHWPYLAGNAQGADRLLLFDALKAMAVASGDRLLNLLVDGASRLNVPHDGGEVPLYFDQFDTEPLVRFWFEPVDGADLV